MKKQIRMILIMITALLILGQASFAAAEPVTMTIDVTYDYEAARELAEILNGYRTSGDAWLLDYSGNRVELGELDELILDDNLTAAAMQRAAELSVNFDHTRPDGTMCISISPDIMGENAGIYYAGAGDMFTAFAEENQDYSGQGHRRNMLSGRYTHVGIGAVVINGQHYWIMEFSAGEPTYTPETGATETTATISINAEKMNQTVELQFAEDKAQAELGGQSELPVVQVVMKNKSTGRVKSRGRTEASWQSADPSVASVDGGVLTGKKLGSTTLTATANGMSISIPVEVVPCLHRQATSEIIAEGDCKTRQTLRFTCPVCGEIWEEEGEYGPHSPVETIRQATCRYQGTYTCQCSVCRRILDHYIIEKTDHQLGDPEIVEEPTAEKEGVSRRTCTVCGYREDTPVPKLQEPDPAPEPDPEPATEPEPEATPAPAPEATPVPAPETEQEPAAEPVTEQDTEPTPEATPEATPEPAPAATPEPTPAPVSTEVPAGSAECSHSRYTTEVIREATCVSVGRVRCTCSDCGKTWEKWTPKDAGNHANLDHASLEERCGYHYDVLFCRACGRNVSQTLVKTGSHVWGDLTVIRAATSETEGLGEHTCIYCRTAEQVVIPRTACTHEHTRTVTVQEAACWREGRFRTECADCGAVLDEWTTPKTEHVYSTEGTLITEATCQTNGQINYPCVNYEHCRNVYCELPPKVDHHNYELRGDQYVCVWCGDSYPAECPHESTRDVRISGYGCEDDCVINTVCTKCGTVVSTRSEAPHAHTPADEPFDCEDPTCTACGRLYYHCLNCPATVSVETSLPLGHDWQVNEEGKTVCTRCGEEKP